MSLASCEDGGRSDPPGPTEQMPGSHFGAADHRKWESHIVDDFLFLQIECEALFEIYFVRFFASKLPQKM